MMPVLPLTPKRNIHIDLERERQRETEREREREREKEREREREREFGWLVGFLTSSSTTRLYRGRVPRQSV